MKYDILDKEYKEFVLNIEENFNKEKNTLFQQRNIIKVLSFNNKKYAVKSFKIPHLLNKVVYRFFRKSKAKRSYLNSVRLIELDINTPKPIGYIEFSKGLLFKESYYISELFDYDFEIRAVFSDIDFKNRDFILDKFIEFTYDLHQKGVYHIDYSPGNILVKVVNGSYIFSIIDVNRMKFVSFDNELRMESLTKLTNLKKDNDFLLHKYSEVSLINKNILSEKLYKKLEKQHNYLERKKKLKKLKFMIKDLFNEK